MNELKYTKDKPYEPGWYWYLTPGDPCGSLRYIRYKPGSAELCIEIPPTGFSNRSEFIPIARIDAYFAGPLVQPPPPVEDDGSEHF